ncbi:MAG: hypothetical protein J5691_00255 [Bacilli bacterium]|nr:hypothetical protein [Bacilli bacterium]
MKKLALIAALLCLTACQAPYNHNVYQATGPRVCYEYYDSFRCSAPQQVWHETVYPKNTAQMQYGYNEYRPYRPVNLSQAVYGTYGY